MPLTSRRRSERPVTELSDVALKQTITDASRVIDSIPDSPPAAEMAKHLAVAEAAARDRQAAESELARRRQAAKQAEKDAALAPLRRAQRLGTRSVQQRALEAVALCANRELVGETLIATLISAEEGEELRRLARRRLDGETLDEAEIARYETLAGKAASDEGLFERKRAQRVEAEKLVALRAAARKHPQAEDLLAAVLSDGFLVDGLRNRLRPDGQGVSAGVVFDYANISSLHVLVALIVQNGGHEIHVREHGVLGEGLPNLPSGSISQLCRNGYLTSAQDGTGMRVGLGPRTREIAKHWGIALPDPSVDADG